MMFARVLARLVVVAIVAAVVLGQPKALHSQGGPCAPYVSSGGDDPPMTGTLALSGVFVFSGRLGWPLSYVERAIIYDQM